MMGAGIVTSVGIHFMTNHSPRGCSHSIDHFDITSQTVGFEIEDSFY